MRTLVTGGSGLVGSTIDSPYKPDREYVNLMHVEDIVRYISRNKIDSIIHCAAKVGGVKANNDQPADFFYDNVVINTNVLEAARITKVKKVVSFLTTCIFPHEAKYPLTIDQIHNGEPHPSNYGYGYAKRMLEVQSRAYRDQHGCNFVTLVPCNIYGPHDNYSLESGHVIPSLIHKCYLAKKNNTNFEIWGTGQAYREFLFSEDLARITERVLHDYDSSEPLIVSPDEEISIAVIAQEIAWRMGFDGNIVYNGQLDGQLRKPSCNENFKTCFPDVKLTPIEVGLDKTINWFVENYDKARK